MTANELIEKLSALPDEDKAKTVRVEYFGFCDGSVFEDEDDILAFRVDSSQITLSVILPTPG